MSVCYTLIYCIWRTTRKHNTYAVCIRACRRVRVYDSRYYINTSSRLKEQLTNFRSLINYSKLETQNTKMEVSCAQLCPYIVIFRVYAMPRTMSATKSRVPVTRSKSSFMKPNVTCTRMIRTV